MPLLLGTFGRLCKSYHSEQLNAFIRQRAQDGTVKSIITDDLCLYAGYKSEESYKADDIINLKNNQGIIIGKLFDRFGNKINHFDNDHIIHHQKEFMHDFWGRYVGVLYDECDKNLTLIRDPLGLMTLFYTVKNDGIIFSTDLALLYDLLHIKPELDLSYFAEFVINKNHALSITPFKDIQELLPGLGLSVSMDGTHSYKLLWDLEASNARYITDPAAFEDELLETLKMSLKAWTRDSSGICVELSGGTDSSGVMLVLREILPTDKRLIAVNNIDSKEPSSNEIEHAKEIAEACDAPLYFIDWQNSSLLDDLPSEWRPNRPSSLLSYYKKSEELCSIARQNNCSDIINGQGGDHVFLAPPVRESLADYWLQVGFKKSSLVAQELLGIYRMPLWDLYRETSKACVRYYCSTKPKSEIDRSFLEPSFSKHHKSNEFYLRDRLIKFHPAKALHIERLHHGVMYSERDQYVYGQTITHPLFSQPVVELGLKIPTYQSFHNGYDRIFFRRAVSRIKKPKALWRRMKGQTTTSVVKNYSQYADIVDQILKEGKLYKCGMINRRWLDREMNRIRHGIADNLWPVVHLCAAQRWLNQWRL